MNKTNCPSCGKGNDTQAAVDGMDRQPTKGHLSICIYCASFAVFTGSGSEKRLPTEAEAVEYSHDTYLVRMREIALGVIAKEEGR